MQPQIPMQAMPSSQNPSQFQFVANANPQLQQPMQASGMPLQQPFMHQQPQLVMSNQQMGMQHIPHGPHPQIPPSHGQPQLTVEENQTILRIAQSLAISTPRGQLEIIRHNLNNMQPDQRDWLIQQNIDPITYFFRSHATRKFLEQKARLGQRAPIDLSVPQQPRPPSQNSLQMQSHQAHPSQVPPPQIADPSFGGSMDQFLGQQQDALRSQEAGQVVVPVSQQRGNIWSTPQQQPNTTLGGSQAMHNMTQAPPAASQYWGNPQMLQGNMQPGQAQAPPHTTTFGNMPTPAQLQGQLGGLSNHVGRVPQQTPNMPNVNKSLKESPQPPNRWHQQRIPQSNQQLDPALPGVPKATPQPGAPVEMDANQQKMRLNQHLASLPPDQRRELMQNYQKRVRATPQMNAQVTESAASQLPQHQAGPQMPLKDVSSNPKMNDADGAHDPALPQQPPLAAIPGPQPAPLQRPQQAARQTAQVAQFANHLTEEQAQQMDQLEFPITILYHAGTPSHLPPTIKTWGQLKTWVSQNNNELPQGISLKIRLLQGLHYQSLAVQNNQVQRNPQNSAPYVQGTIRPSAPTAPMVPVRINGQPSQAGSMSSIAQGPRVTGALSVPQPTVQEIQAWRARLTENRLPENFSITDEQISQLIFKQRQDELVKSQGQQNISIHQVSNPNRQRAYQPDMQPQQYQTPSNQPTPLVPPGQRPQHQQGSRPAGNGSKEQPAKQTSNRNVPQTQNQGHAKRIKRNSNDDVVEVANPNSTKQEPQAHSIQAQTADQLKSNLQQTVPEQFSSAHAPKQPVNAEQAVNTTQSASEPTSQLSTQAAQSKAQLEAEQRKSRLHQLVTETIQTMPARQPILMSPQVKAKMTQKLRDARAMVQRLDHALPIFYKIFGDEKTARDLIRIVCLIFDFF